MKDYFDKDTIILFLFFGVVPFLLFCNDSRAASRTDEIVREMVTSKCSMRSLRACFHYHQNRFVTEHCTSAGWQCTSREQIEALTVMFCDGVCAGVLMNIPEEEK